MSVSSPIEIEESSDDAFVILIQNLSEENRREGTQSTTERDFTCICRVPQNLAGICSRATEPELVSIGPYHRDKHEVRGFRMYKLEFLRSLLSRIQEPQSSLRRMCRAMKELEYEARRRYSEPIDMSSDDFVQMMLLDGCFIIELFQQVCGSDDSTNANSLVFMKPWLIPILIGDLLKLENQLPFFVLERLSEYSIGNTEVSLVRQTEILGSVDEIFCPQDEISDSLDETFGSQANTSDPLVLQAFVLQALKCFNLVLPRSLESFKYRRQLWRIEENYHLLHLFYRSYSLPKRSFANLSNTSERRWLPRLSYLSNLTNLYRRRSHESPRYRPLSDQSIPCVTRLRHAGVKFRRQKGSRGNFLHINFHEGVLQLPPMIINDFTSTILINCVAFEQCYPRPTWKYFSEYIAFMSCLLNSSRDVTFLCDKGIISNFSYSDKRVANLFKKLGEHVVFNVRECYLKNEFREVEAYYSSNWATLRRTYFSSPWSTISAVSASFLLALTAIQTIIAILSYKVPHS
ncbi:UPF0481 protein [Camellia lanceoleosa]|uniref:UPF0481 protein n=1 Tax=Camellia lanceoleosa TaxID=1840588 RepID=A0ACC0G5V4_9ERIC|nr:UPF0481 protein [Camellia lanceoleosa]